MLNNLKPTVGSRKDSKRRCRGVGSGLGKNGDHPATGEIYRLPIVGEGDAQHVARISLHHRKGPVAAGRGDIQGDVKGFFNRCGHGILLLAQIPVAKDLVGIGAQGGFQLLSAHLPVALAAGE